MTESFDFDSLESGFNGARTGNLKDIKAALKICKHHSGYLLDIAIISNQMAAVKYLFKIVPENHRLGFFTALNTKNLEILELFLKKWKNINAETQFFLNAALDDAALYGRMDIAKLMLKKGANNYNLALESAVAWGNIEVVKVAIKKGANTNLKNGQGKPLVDDAKERGFTDIYKLLKTINTKIKKQTSSDDSKQ